MLDDQVVPVTAGPAAAGTRSGPAALGVGAVVGVLGGLVGLCGAECRLPLLSGLFGFAALQAMIMNEAMGLVVVATALPARLTAVPVAELTPSRRRQSSAGIIAGPLAAAALGTTPVAGNGTAEP